ncbi:sugar transferase [Paenibacillus sp. PL91]|uniref:sugar transferase n=1 Tax=Paenibacillus sp. PL91 TaxID=2729538 RepID=UPI00145DCA26|nr:sugar transferase [Paenibacillus sp. PL91]MBC9202861.1 sugar transferase [Paenibacillus sp. PL91]
MYRHFFKRLFDLVLALIALPFWLIILIIVSPIIYFQDNGSIFYNASRLGKNGKIFKMYKFRSMKMSAPDIRNEDGSTFNSEDDPRLTKIGKILRKTSLDETPQLLNIIKGEMSIIGPRPDLPEAINIYQGDERLKISVRPGVTGYSQAYYRNSISAKDKFANDIYYVNHISLLLDLKIIIKTVLSVLKNRNIYVSAD